jgi:peptidase M23-like protein
LLKLTTILPLLLSLIWTPAAFAWSWPVQGPVLVPFSYDESHPYAAGQHRGIDIGADAAGETVVAPAGGTISFAGTVPTSGKTVTIATAEGYSVTLTHLGSIAVVKGATVAERDPVGTIGPSGTAELDVPYVHLGIRLATDPSGYLDPLGLLPFAADGGTTQSGSAAAQPSSGGATSAAPASPPAASTTPSPTSSSPPASAEARPSRASNVVQAPPRVPRHVNEHASAARLHVRQTRSRLRPPVEPGKEASPRAPHHERTSRPRASAQTSSSRRPVVETAAPPEPTGLDAGHEIPSAAPSAERTSMLRRTPSAPVPLILNGAAALVALGAALTAARSRRRRSGTTPAAANVLDLPGRSTRHQPASRAA